MRPSPACEVLRVRQTGASPLRLEGKGQAEWDVRPADFIAILEGSGKFQRTEVRGVEEPTRVYKLDEARYVWVGSGRCCADGGPRDASLMVIGPYP